MTDQPSDRPAVPFEQYGKPIRVDGGLKARSAKGDIGDEWWSRRFIDVLESFSMGTRLTRGRAYARKGQVISLAIAPGEATASVQGSRVRPYQVTIGLPVFSELLWAKVEVALAEQAIHSARLLAGQFPAELEPVFARAGAPFFPARLSDLRLSCTCPDPVVPCKHIAAAFYLLAERFDDDPFAILHWRGRSRDELLGRLRQLRGEEAGTPTDDVQLALDAEPPVGARVALTGASIGAAAGAAADEVNSFWTPGEPLPPPTHPALPADLLLRSLPTPGAALGGSRLLAHLAPLYDHLTET